MGNSKLARNNFLQGRDMIDKQNYQQAEIKFRKSIQNNPKYAVSHYNLAMVFDLQQKYQQAIQSYNNYIKLCPNDSDAFYNLAITFKKANQYQEAIKAYKKAIQIKPDYSSAHYNLAVLYDDLQKFQQAIKQFKKTLQITPQDADAWYNLGISLRNICNYQQALISYQKAISIKKDYVQAYYNMGVSYDDLGCYQKAQKAYKKAIEYNPNYGNAHHNLGIALDYQGKTQQAKKFYEKAIEIQPHNILYRANFGNFYLKVNDIKKASNCFYQIDKIFQLPQSKEDNFLSDQNIQISHVNHVFQSMKLFRSTYGELQKLECEYKENKEAISIIEQQRASIIMPISKLLGQEEQKKTEEQQKQDCAQAETDIFKMIKELQIKLRNQFKAQIKKKDLQIKKLNQKVKNIEDKMVTKDQIQSLCQKLDKYGQETKQIKQEIQKIKAKYLPDESLKLKLQQLKKKNRNKIVKYSQNLYWMLNTSIAAYRMLKMKIVKKGEKTAKGKVGWFVSKIAKVLRIAQHIPVVGDVCELIISFAQNYCEYSQELITQKICQLFSQQWNQRDISNAVSCVVVKIISDSFYCQIIQKFQGQKGFLERICFIFENNRQKSMKMIQGIKMQKQQNSSRMALADCTFIICKMLYINKNQIKTATSQESQNQIESNQVMMIAVDNLIEKRQSQLLKN